jgi:hypothetical protein
MTTTTITKPITFSTEQQTQLKQVEKVAHRLVELCRNGKFDQAIQELYADNAISNERMEMPGWPKEFHGKKAILEGSKKWADANEVHGMEIGEPICSTGHFAVRMDLDTTNKLLDNTRMACSELCLYEVIDSKIVRVDFHYPMCDKK